MRQFSLFISLFFIAATGYAQGNNLKLWYNKPAGDTWEAALPVGNGRIAAMVFGNPASEVIKLNESTVWSGGPNRNDNPHALAILPQVRKLIFEGNYTEASKLAAQNIQSEGINGMKYQPVGDINMLFPGYESYENYYRELDIEKAIITTSFTIKGIKYKRSVFASIPDQVIVIHLEADKPASVSFQASFSSLQKSVVSTDNNELILIGTTGDHEGVTGKVKFMSVAKIVTHGGTIISAEKGLQVNGADEAIIYISVATNFVNYHDLTGNENKKSRQYVDKALKRGYAQVLRDHIRAYQKYFNRVSLDLGITDAVKKPTDERLKDFANGNDPQLITLYFQFGRYLLISCSQPGGQPANLQGIWNDKMNPPWDSKYTININTEMNYWPAEPDNLTEMHEPLIQMVKELSQTGRETAKVMYGANGWVAHHNTDLWRITGPVDGIFYGMWPMGGAWLSRHLWEKYLYSGNRKYLQSVYPALKGAAQFYLDFLMEEPVHHWLVVSPSISPENSPKIANGKSIAAGVTMDNQIVFDLFSNVINAAAVLDIDKKFAADIKAARLRLPPMQVGQYNQLQEWMQDMDDPSDKHRHVSHLFGLYPGNQISPYHTPDLFMAARQTLIYRGDISTGWSMGWKVNFWARLLDGDHAYQLIKDQLTPAGTHAGGGGTYPNLFDAHPPFQIDGNFGCTAGITEMLLQCHDGAINVLPALPGHWKSGIVKGLRAAGGFEIKEMEWRNGILVKLIIKSALGGNCRIRVPARIKSMGNNILKPASGINNNPFYKIDEVAAPLVRTKANPPKPQLKETWVYDLSTSPGKEYILPVAN